MRSYDDARRAGGVPARGERSGGSGGWFGPYPFSSTGAIADNATYNGRPHGFSLETQTKPVYSAVRSTTTIAHELAHEKIGDDAFFTILKTWTAKYRRGNATTQDFIALAEKISGRDLGAFFQTSLYTAGKPTTG